MDGGTSRGGSGQWPGQGEGQRCKQSPDRSPCNRFNARRDLEQNWLSPTVAATSGGLGAGRFL